MYLNSVTLTGFLGGDAETRTIKDDVSLTVFSVATKNSWKDPESGEWVSRTEWHRVIAWSKLGEFALSLKSGAHVQVEGELRSREYQKDGAKHRVWECKAFRIAKLDRIERADDNTPAGEAADDQPPF